MIHFMNLIHLVYNFLWGDLITIPLPGGSSLGLSLLVLLLVPTAIYFTLRTRFLPFRLFPEMLRVSIEKRNPEHRDGISGLQALIVSTATRWAWQPYRCGCASRRRPGAIFWWWVMALLGSATAFAEATLAQIYKQRDPLYGGFRGGPAYYIHALFVKPGSRKKRSIIAILFALSGLLCWCGISQVIGNSVSSAFRNAFHIPPLYTTIVLVLVAAFIVLRKNATVKVLDVVVPVMAGLYFFLTLFIIFKHIGQVPAVFARIFQEAFAFARRLPAVWVRSL